MFKKLLRRAGAVALAGGLIGAGFMGAAAPAQAASTMTITGYGANYSSLNFSASGCKTVQMRLQGSLGSETKTFKAWTPVYRDGKRVATVTSSFESQTAKLNVCPKTMGFGKFWFGHSTVKETLRSGATRTFTAPYVKVFYAKGAIKGSVYAKRSGSKVSVTSYLKHFSATQQKFVVSTRSDVKLQRYSSGAWRTIKTLSYRNGAASYVTYNNTRYSYRIVVPATKVTWEGKTSGLYM